MDSILLAFVPSLAIGGVAAAATIARRRRNQERQIQTLLIGAARFADHRRGMIDGIKFSEDLRKAFGDARYPTSQQYLAAINWAETMQRRREMERALADAGGVDLRDYVERWR